MVMARTLEGMTRPAPVEGVTVEAYRNAWADDYVRAEAEAMEGLAVFAEMGQPTGYEGAEGFDAAVVAREDGAIVGFAQAMLPEGWINWIGVVPGARRRGIARQMIAEVARQVTEARGTHLAVMIEPGTPAQGFFAAAGFRERGARRTLMIRRA